MARINLVEALFFVLLFLIVAAVIYSPQYTGKITAEGGEITQVELQHTITNDYWYGLYGNVSEYYENDSASLGGKKIRQFNVSVVKCDNAQLYATPSEEIDWSDVEPAEPWEVDNFLEVSSDSPYSGTSLFTSTSNFSINNNTMALSSTTLNTGEGKSRMGILSQNGSLIYVTNISSIISAADVLSDYQLMLPGNITYNFFMDDADKLRCNKPPVILEVEDNEFMQNKTTTINIEYFEPNKDPVTLETNLERAELINITDKTIRINWTPSFYNVGEKNITFVLEDIHGNAANYSYKVEVLNKNDPPRFEYARDIDAYLHEPYNATFVVFDPDVYSNETPVIEFNTSPQISNMNFDTTYNKTDKRYYGRLNFTPLNSQKGRREIEIIATDGDFVTKQKINMTVGFCGDYDEAGEPKCDSQYEDCLNCPEDCGPCPEEEKESMALEINRSREHNFSTVKALKLVPRNTCPQQGEIINDKEVCGVVKDAEIRKSRLSNGSWDFEESAGTDDAGSAKIKTYFNNTYKITASKDNYHTASSYIGKSYLQEEGEEQSPSENKTEITEENKTQPATEEPKPVTEKKQMDYTKIISFYAVVVLGMLVLCYFIHIEYFKK